MKQPELIIEDMGPQDRPVAATKRDLRDLADDINANGLNFPILVMDGIVIDGLKRIEAYKLLGRARIPALVTNNFGEAAFFIASVRGDGVLEPPRNVEVAEQLEPFRQQYHKIRYYPKLAKENKSKPWGKLSSRQLLAHALGTAESYAEALILMVGVAKTDPEIARRVALIKKGQDTIHGVYSLYRRRKGQYEFVNTPAAEIRSTLERGFQTMETTLAAMSKYGSMLTLSRDERAAIVQQIDSIRRQVFHLAKGIKEGLLMEAKEGQQG